MIPTQIHLHKKTQVLDIEFKGEKYAFSAEFLRVHSPSAEVKGHSGHGGSLPIEKKYVQITKLEPAGNYALRIYFNDGHTSGLYTWQYLREMGQNQVQLWDTYLKKLSEENKTREPEAQILHFPAEKPQETP